MKKRFTTRLEEREKIENEEKAFKPEIKNNGIMLFHWLASSRSGAGRASGQDAEDLAARSAALSLVGIGRRRSRTLRATLLSVSSLLLLFDSVTEYQSKPTRYREYHKEKTMGVRQSRYGVDAEQVYGIRGAAAIVNAIASTMKRRYKGVCHCRYMTDEEQLPLLTLSRVLSGEDTGGYAIAGKWYIENRKLHQIVSSRSSHQS